ncbi:MAG: hypothetical protein FJY85_08725 [Deltaproteobacteria bacterium]|nr:hypothetical protein [Deltaproteobacteria bacterium]
MEREHILEYLRSTLKERLGVSVVVTRNVHKEASVKNMPIVYVIHGADKVYERTSGPIVKRQMDVRIESVFRGSTESKALQELAEFQYSLRKALHGPNLNRVVGTTYKGIMYETETSDVYLPAGTSPNIVAQTIYFEVLYLENQRRLLS